MGVMICCTIWIPEEHVWRRKSLLMVTLTSRRSCSCSCWLHLLLCLGLLLLLRLRLLLLLGLKLDHLRLLLVHSYCLHTT